MARKLLCKGPRCHHEKLKYAEEEMTIYEGERYCTECYAPKLTEKEDKRELHNYICKIFNQKIVDGRIQADIKKLQKDGITLKDIRFTLYYLISVKNFMPQVQYGVLTIVRNNYQSMRQHRIEKETQKARMKDVTYDNTPIKIKMKPPKRRFDYKESKLINLEELANAINQRG